MNDVKEDVKEEVIVETIKKPRFKSLYNNDYKYSCPVYDHVVKTYKVLPPYSKDPNTGKWLNESSEFTTIESGSYNLDEEIQSYAKEVDLYHILEKFANSGNTDLINRVKGSYGDISSIPTNFNDLNVHLDNAVKDFDKVPNELKAAVIDENLSSDELKKQFDDFIKARLAKAAEAKAAEAKKGEGDV